ncbi:hypothetical protein [Sinomonas mesophila]|uniref:hypothetical protein n=1 Tax=Sinomonas mesophila TaxID=1531955 RepID=UPI000985656D|nr:hypothetical protein [Sinomonas mesophila]
MSDGYEVFDTGHNGWRPVRQHLNAAQTEKVLNAVRRLQPASLEEARLLLRHAAGHRIEAISDLYDVELQPVLEKLGRMERERTRIQGRTGGHHA